MPRKLEKKQSAKGRRGNNEGSIYQRSDGRWCAQVVSGYKENGSPIRKYVYARTRAEAAQKASQMTAAVFEAGYINSEMNAGAVTVSELARSWLIDYKQFSVTPRTFEWYRDLTNTHITPNLGKFKVVDIQPLQVQRIFNSLLDKGRAPKTVKSVQFVARQLFAHAMEMKIISENPAQKTKIQRFDRQSREEKSKAIPIEHRSQILEAAETQANIKPIITTLMFSGLRSGELIALKWKHINFDAMTITVDGAVTLDCRFDENGNRIWSESIVSSTKTMAGFRTIRVSSRVISVLREWQEYQVVEGLVSKKKLIEPDCFVFPTKTGEMRTYTGFRSLLRRFLDKNGFGDLGIHAHSFRHTFATILLENNVNPRVVQMYLGHNDVETTLNIYSSVATEVFNKAARRIDEVYDAMLNGTYEPLAPNTECSP